MLITPTVVTPGTPTIDEHSLDKIDRLERDQIEDAEELDDEMEFYFGGDNIAAVTPEPTIAPPASDESGPDDLTTDPQVAELIEENASEARPSGIVFR